MSSASFEGNLLNGDGLPGPKGRWGRGHFVALIALGAVLWSVFAWGVMPRLISSAYEGHGISHLVKAMEHKGAHSLDHYLGKWNKLAAALLGAWVGAGGILLLTTSRWFAQNVARTATPGTLGAIRMAICLILAWVTWWMRLVETIQLPESQRISMGVMDFFYAAGWGYVVKSVVLVQTLKWTCIALCFLGAAGYRTRIVLPAIALLYLPLAGITRSYFWFNHCGIVPWYCLIVLCFTRCGDGWSVDRLLRIWRGQGVPDANVRTAHYGWARLFVWLCVCIPYFLAGISKLVYASPMWWTGNNMQAILFADGLRPGGETLAMQLTFLPGWFFTMMGIGTIIAEVGFITVPFWRVSRYLLPVAMFSMHMGIWTVMGINFYDLLFIQWIFFDWSPLVRWIGQKLEAKRGTITVLFDGNCPLCQRTIRVLRTMDILGRLNPTDFRKADLPRLAASHHVTLDPQHLEREMIVIRNDQTYGGAQGARIIAGALPALWIVYPLLAIPGLSNIASVVYRSIARNRMSLLKCDPAGVCTIERPATASAVGAAAQTQSSWLRRLAPGLGVATMFCCMLGWWTTKLEWYPITCMQMFTWYNADENGNPSSVVNYYRAYVIYEDGTKSLAKFDRMGGGIARYQNALAAPFLVEVPQRVRDQGKAACVDLMTRSANWWNANAATPGKRIVRMETHHRQWDFVNERHDHTDWGKTKEAIVVEIKPDALTSTVASGR
jgi:predicted DCC family thiol-disulfide oxidoreductase YuxK